MLPHYSDATIWGPQGDPNQERARLKPGDRLQDGRIFAGDDPEAGLLAALKQVDTLLGPLTERRNALLQKLSGLSPEKYGHFIIGVEDETDVPPWLARIQETEPLVEEVEPLGYAQIAETVIESSEETQVAFEPFMEAPIFTEQVDLSPADPPASPPVKTVRRPKKDK